MSRKCELISDESFANFIILIIKLLFLLETLALFFLQVPLYPTEVQLPTEMFTKIRPCQLCLTQQGTVYILLYIYPELFNKTINFQLSTFSLFFHYEIKKIQSFQCEKSSASSTGSPGDSSLCPSNGFRCFDVEIR